ncbi:hypothetical protein KI387_032810, partial [Taxus chinensis]
DEVVRNTKVKNDVMVNEFTYLLNFCRNEGNGLYPFSVIFCSGYDPLVALRRMGIDLAEKIQAPLRKGPE